MKKITTKEANALIDQGAGVVHFMGGCESKNNLLIVSIEEGDYLFSAEEIERESYKDLMKIVENESLEFISHMGYSLEN